MESLSGYQIISLVGYQGSGKSTVGKLLAHLLNCRHVETSAVVKKVTGVEKRENLASTGKQTKIDPDWLGSAVAEHVVQASKKLVVLTGVRERAVHEFLISFAKQVDIIELTSPPELRFDRVKELGKVSTAAEFIEQELKEKELGLEDVICNATYQIPTTEKTDPVDIARAIVTVLDLEDST